MYYCSLIFSFYFLFSLFLSLRLICCTSTLVLPCFILFLQHMCSCFLFPSNSLFLIASFLCHLALMYACSTFLSVFFFISPYRSLVFSAQHVLFDSLFPSINILCYKCTLVHSYFSSSGPFLLNIYFCFLFSSIFPSLHVLYLSFF